MGRYNGSELIKKVIPHVAKESRILKFIDKKKHDYILDVGCGIGAFASLLRAYGLNVHAFDISPKLMNRAYERMLRDGLESDLKYLRELKYKTPDHVPAPKLWVGDAVKAVNYISGPYSVILCLGGALGYTSDPERVLTLMMESLDTKGRLYLEIENSKSAVALRRILSSFARFEFKKAFRDLKEMIYSSKVEKEEKIVLGDGREASLNITQISIKLLEELAQQSNCRIRLVLGPAWLRDLKGSRKEKGGVLEAFLARFAPFNRFAQDIWVEIDKN